MTKGAQNALKITLSVHAVMLFSLTKLTVFDQESPLEQFAEIEFFNPEDLPDPEEIIEPVDLIQERINERVSNLRSDASKETSSEERSTGVSEVEQAAIDKAVEKELADLESSEMNRLSSEKKEFETVGLPDESDNNRQVDTMDDWDKQYDGLVTVRFNLKNRSAQHLEVPGYQCKGRSEVVVSITVDSSGEVLSVDLLSGADPHTCFAEAALKSAKSSRFLPSSSAPRRQKGTLTYAFVAQ